jgi:hypothetical protein
VNALYRGWSALLFLLIMLQVGFAGYGAFAVANDLDDEGATVDQDRFEDLFGLHVGFGLVILVAGLIFLGIGLAAGIGRWRLGRHGLLFLLLIVQTLLGGIGIDAPEVGGFLHAFNALIVFTLAGWIAWSEWRTSRGVAQPSAPAA